MHRLVAILTLLLINSTKVLSLNEQEVNCVNVESRHCELHQVNIQNNSTKIRILDENLGKIEKISFENSTILIFPKEFLTQTPNLSNLEMENVQLTEIPDFSFQNASKLEIMDLEFNELTEIGENTFDGAKKMIKLYLGNNKIRKISPKAFEDVANLEVLFLEKNDLEVIDARTFASLKKLMHLVLTDNDIKYVATRAFVNLPNLYEIHLDNNEMESLELHIDRKLDLVDVSGNKLTSLNLKSINPKAKIHTIKASDNELSSLNVNSSLEVKEIYLTDNEFKNFKSFALQKNLSRLIIRENSFENLQGIEKLKNLEHLDIGNNNITFEKGVFKPLQNLERLVLSNMSMKNFDLSWFGVLDELSSLDLGENQLKELDYKELKTNFPELERITISENQFGCDYLEEMFEFLTKEANITVMDVDDKFRIKHVHKIECIEEDDETSLLSIILFVIGGVAVLGVIGYFVWKTCKKSDEDE
ncbi:leucine-rich repeat-containing protein 15-like [Culicoides brevitarsis]|uniref:leucine-rich repeat-containing protein 15-like n=1 Tax=Culicoides brevitarsis TaxID=469753 RepID=UPI00307CBC60